jgi:hypothetical protein
MYRTARAYLQCQVPSWGALTSTSQSCFACLYTFSDCLVLLYAGYSNGEGAWGAGSAPSYQSTPAVIGLDDVNNPASVRGFILRLFQCVYSRGEQVQVESVIPPAHHNQSCSDPGIWTLNLPLWRSLLELCLHIHAYEKNVR